MAWLLRAVLRNKIETYNKYETLTNSWSKNCAITMSKLWHYEHIETLKTSGLTYTYISTYWNA